MIDFQAPVTLIEEHSNSCAEPLAHGDPSVVKLNGHDHLQRRGLAQNHGQLTLRTSNTSPSRNLAFSHALQEQHPPVVCESFIDLRNVQYRPAKPSLGALEV